MTRKFLKNKNADKLGVLRWRISVVKLRPLYVPLWEEVDGITHQDGDVAKKDGIRQRKLEEAGFIILRFEDEDVLNHINSVIATIDEKIEKIENHPLNPPPNALKLRLRKVLFLPQRSFPFAGNCFEAVLTFELVNKILVPCLEGGFPGRYVT